MTMSLQDYIEQMKADSDEWFNYEDREAELKVFVLGLCGESGEVADLLKKYLRGTLSYEAMEGFIATELIDVFHYWCMLINLFKIDVEQIYLFKRELNVQRFGR